MERNAVFFQFSLHALVIQNRVPTASLHTHHVFACVCSSEPILNTLSYLKDSQGFYNSRNLQRPMKQPTSHQWIWKMPVEFVGFNKKVTVFPKWSSISTKASSWLQFPSDLELKRRSSVRMDPLTTCRIREGEELMCMSQTPTAAWCGANQGFSGITNKDLVETHQRKTRMWLEKGPCGSRAVF